VNCFYCGLCVGQDLSASSEVEGVIYKLLMPMLSLRLFSILSPLGKRTQGSALNLP